MLHRLQTINENKYNIQNQVIHQTPFLLILQNDFLVNALMVGGGWMVVILLLLTNVNNTLSTAGISDKHNYLNMKVYPEGQKGAA